MNQSSAENFMRSAKAPVISAGVMIAKVIWKIMKTLSGIVPLSASDGHAARGSSLRRGRRYRRRRRAKARL